MAIYLKPGFGYWDYTFYPIGGDFHRAPEEGMEILELQELKFKVKGCNACGKNKEGHKVAFSLSDTETR